MCSARCAVARGGASRRYADHDTAIRRAVDEWQRRISPMAELAEPRMPPAAVWEAIERRLGLTTAREAARPRTVVETPARPSRSLFDNLAFWRGWAIGVTALAAVAVVVAVRSLLPSATTQPGTRHRRAATRSRCFACGRAEQQGRASGHAGRVG